MDEEFSILNSVKKMIGISSDYKVFDQDLIVHIHDSTSVGYWSKKRF